jgi:hypothetical protein
MKYLTNSLLEKAWADGTWQVVSKYNNKEMAMGHTSLKVCPEEIWKCIHICISPASFEGKAYAKPS